MPTDMTVFHDHEPSLSLQEVIRIRGARTHNLKNISIDIPRHQLVVLTGLSGSGKSSLAFDTLYAEGQRRYVESLSAYARQFLQLMDKPDVDLIEGLSPAIAIEQKTAGHNPRSTVGTVTEIHDYLRLLYARVGTPHCPIHQEPLEAQSVSHIVDTILALPEDTRISLLAPIIRHKKGNIEDKLIQLQTQGFIRVRINGEIQDIDTVTLPNPQEKNTIEVVVDRLKVRTSNRQRLADSIETAIKLSDGQVLLFNMDTEEEIAYSTKYACPICGYSIDTLEPRLFSFNNPVGACPSCDGLGVTQVFDEKRIVVFPELSLKSGAIAGWDARNRFSQMLLNSLALHYQFDIETPFNALDERIQHILLHGSGEEEIDFLYLNDDGRTTIKKHTFEGIIPNLERRWSESESTHIKEELAKYRSTVICPTCHGSRLKEAARYVMVGNDIRPNDKKKGLGIYEVEALSLSDCLAWFEQLTLTGTKQEIAERIVKEIQSRLVFLNNVGLNYLSLDRSADTISGGEAQRIRLASQIGSGLTGVMYVLDEPSIGLHQRDNDRLIQTLQHLRDLGNSVIVVEHDEDMIRSADWVIDMGPGAGELGGEVIATGTAKALMQQKHSLTGDYLSGRKRIQSTHFRPIDEHTKWLHLKGCTGNNLKSVDLAIPLGKLVCVTGVSGSGKSTLINETLAAILMRDLNRAHTEPAPYESIEGIEVLDKLINVDQSPIGRTPRSNPATYTGLFTPIRELFAGTPEARARGYDAGRFSFNVKGGRCEICQGDGVIKVEMHFLPDVYVPCDTCKGKRYNQETLDIRYRGHNISEVLDMTVSTALTYFSAVPAIARRLQTLVDVGLGYIRLGQSATTLSGGEAQRIKLSLELSKRSTGKTLYILDEPTTGLHFADIELLLQVINQLVDAGNSVVIIEHNLDVIKTADWIIDLGPEGGQNGGQIIATGIPADIVKNPQSLTGKYLEKYL
ncbi:excinuclease ABC subunit UvrA [Pelistega ratti]|nr:excinuclease ABC subunit UvrA [Pelistega ratti]